MAGPFPGMDPYLEGADIWPDVHLRLIAAIGDALAPRVEPGYYVRIDRRTYIIEVDREERVIRPDAVIIASGPETARPGDGGAATVVSDAVQTVILPLYDE